jgi:hypothetical protein
MQPQKKRRRGALLTSQGLCRLQNAKQQIEYNENQRFTLDLLSTRSGLDSHTLCKIFNQSARVDKGSLAKCFQAFNLVLQPDDYNSSTASASKLNPTTVEGSPLSDILDEIGTLPLDEQRVIIDILQLG